MDDFNESLCSLYSHSNDDLNQTFQFHSSFDENMVTTEKTISDSDNVTLYSIELINNFINFLLYKF